MAHPSSIYDIRIRRSHSCATVQHGLTMDHMSDTNPTDLERAIAAEVRLEVTRQRLTRKALAESAGLDNRAYGRYFVECERHIPVDALDRIAGALGLQVSELTRRAESADHLAD